jgi:hypothetical protein
MILLLNLRVSKVDSFSFKSGTMNLCISTQKSKNLKSPTTPNEFKRETELPNKVFFYNYLIGVQKPKGFFDKETQDLNKDQPIYHFIQQEKTSIECIQFHGTNVRSC